MPDLTKTAAQLMDWTLLDDTAAVPSLETTELSLADDVGTTLHIDICNIDASAGTAGSCVIIWIKSGTTDEDWHEFLRYGIPADAAGKQDCDAVSASGQPNINITGTIGFDEIGIVYFLLDTGTLADSCIVISADVVTGASGHVVSMDNLVNAYDAADDLLVDAVHQWNPKIPAAIKACRVTFHNVDADANYACRVRHSKSTDLE